MIQFDLRIFFKWVEKNHQLGVSFPDFSAPSSPSGQSWQLLFALWSLENEFPFPNEKKPADWNIPIKTNRKYGSTS